MLLLNAAGGHIMRVNAIGPNLICPGPSDFHVAFPRLQSTRMLTLPFPANASVYLSLSPGVSTVSSPPRNSTSLHDVPASPAAESFTVCAATVIAKPPTSPHKSHPAIACLIRVSLRSIRRSGDRITVKSTPKNIHGLTPQR